MTERGNLADVLDEFNERAEEFGVTEKDIISVTALPAKPGAVIVKNGTKPVNSIVQVVITYWADSRGVALLAPVGDIAHRMISSCTGAGSDVESPFT